MKLINRTKYTCDNLSNFLHLFELGKDEVCIMLCDNYPEFFSSEFIAEYITRAEQIKDSCGIHFRSDPHYDLTFREMTDNYFENAYIPDGSSCFSTSKIMEFFLSTKIKPFNKGWWHLDVEEKPDPEHLPYNIFMFREVEKYGYHPIPPDLCRTIQTDSSFKNKIRIKVGFLDGNIKKARRELESLESRIDAITEELGYEKPCC